MGAINNSPSLSAPAGEGALGPYLQAIRAHRILVGFVILAALAGAIALLDLRSAEYEATAQLLVTPLPQDDDTFLGVNMIRDSGDPTRTVQTAAALIGTPEAGKEAALRLGGITGRAVLDAVKVEPQGESNILGITATADDAGRSARIANRFAEASLAVRKRVLKGQINARITQLRATQRKNSRKVGDTAAALAERLNQLESVRDGSDPTLQLARRASVPGSPSGPSAPLILILALIAGVALGAGAAVLSELFNRRIRDEEEAATLYPLPVLARVPLLPRRIRRSPNGQTRLPPQVREAFRTLIVQITDEKDEAEGRRVLMITSASSGDGKTSSAVNLAVSLAAAGHETILMDLDIRKPDIARFLGLSDTVPLADLISPKKKLEVLLSAAPHVPSLRVLATGQGSSGDLVEALSQRMPQLIAQARTLAEFVVIDTAPVGEVSDALRIMSEVDSIVAVTRPGNTDRVDYDVMRDLLERTSNDPYGLLVIGHAPGMSRNHYRYGYGDDKHRRGSRAARRPR